jgi:two-component system chemotaxis response regulator CheB
MVPLLPILRAAIVIVQHITPVIDLAFTTSLARKSRMPVKLAKDGDLLSQGQICIAPGGVHLTLVSNQKVHLYSGEKVNSVCPSIDVTMKSVGPQSGGKLVGVILSGMGRDGADGLVHLKGYGAITIAQDQKTCVIYGMPKAAAETGKVDFVLPTTAIARKLADLFG